MTPESEAMVKLQLQAVYACKRLNFDETVELLETIAISSPSEVLEGIALLNETKKGEPPTPKESKDYCKLVSLIEDDGDRIKAIKQLREMTGCGLKRAKGIVDHIWASGTMFPEPMIRYWADNEEANLFDEVTYDQQKGYYL